MTQNPVSFVVGGEKDTTCIIVKLDEIKYKRNASLDVGDFVRFEIFIRGVGIVITRHDKQP